MWAEGPLGRGHSTSKGAVHAFGDRTAVPERVTCPRLEWIAPGRADCPRPGTLVATTHPGCDAGKVVCPGCDAGRDLCQAMAAGGLQETAWKGTLKTVVQRPAPWLTLRLPPRASTRRRAPSRPRPEEKAS